MFVLLDRGGEKSGATRSRETELDAIPRGPILAEHTDICASQSSAMTCNAHKHFQQSRYVGFNSVMVTEMEVEAASTYLGMFVRIVKHHRVRAAVTDRYQQARQRMKTISKSSCQVISLSCTLFWAAILAALRLRCGQ